MQDLRDISRGLGDVVAKAEPGVVSVHASRCESSTGVVWDRDLVVTSAHAVDREQGIEVTVGGQRLPAELAGMDPGSDLAVLRVSAALPPLPRASSDALRVGELVLALGRRAGSLRARFGILGRLGGAFRLGSGVSVDRYVESDIAPGPGLSGGPLVTAAGELVGVNSGGLVRGVLLALPATTVDGVVAALVAHGRVRRAQLGVALQRVELPRVLRERLTRRFGLVVLGVVEGSPAEQGGLLVGDILLALGSHRLERVDDLRGALDESAIDVELEAELVRAGEEKKLLLRPRARD